MQFYLSPPTRVHKVAAGPTRGSLEIKPAHYPLVGRQESSTHRVLHRRRPFEQCLLCPNIHLPWNGTGIHWHWTTVESLMLCKNRWWKRATNRSRDTTGESSFFFFVLIFSDTANKSRHPFLFLWSSSDTPPPIGIFFRFFLYSFCDLLKNTNLSLAHWYLILWKNSMEDTCKWEYMQDFSCPNEESWYYHTLPVSPMLLL